MRFPVCVCVLLCCFGLSFPASAQSANGNINGSVGDPANSVIVGAEVIAQNDATGAQYRTKTNNEGIFVLPDLPPGRYRVQVSKLGFKTVIKPEIVLNVQDALSLNFTMPVGAAYEVLTVEGGAPLVDTENATVSTVVDRQFAENLPMNGRSFQTLIELTPGVVLTPSNALDGGQFSVNGQRADANYWMVDGVGANIGVSSNFIAGGGLAGGLPSFSVLGGTNSLVSVDALQEFRIQTSTYAPEFGRTPGGQVSIVTRSGTNQIRGTLFDYFRNDVLDANDWFADRNLLPKPKERQNDFGGTFSGPILKDRTFFFFSYEGLRLRLPQVTETTVPDTNARQGAIPAIQPYLNAFPIPNGPDHGSGIAEFNASYSNPASLNAYSLRIDHRINDKLSAFARYNNSPSSIVQRGVSLEPLSVLSFSKINTQTITAGAAWIPSPVVTNDFRFNYSGITGSSHLSMDDFGGATPLQSLPFPPSFNTGNSEFGFIVLSLSNGFFGLGKVQSNQQKQFNVVDNVSFQKGTHTIKFGVDYRRLSPVLDTRLYYQEGVFLDVPSSESGNPFFTFVEADRGATLLFHNLGLFGQDTWRASSRLTLSYGLRWDVDVAPSTSSGPQLLAVTGFDLSNLSNLALAPAGTPVFRTTYGNIAPRLGVAYQLRQTPGRETVLRGGFGVFYDLATQEFGNQVQAGTYPFGASITNCCFTGSFPLSPAEAAPPAITAASLAAGTLTAFDPNLKLPYTLQWNVAAEQGLGAQQTISASYVGAVGRRLIQSGYMSAPNANFGSVSFVANTATSDYDALQVKFQRRLSSNLQALVSYSFAHSVDTASAGSNYFLAANSFAPGGSGGNRGPSDFDVRHSLSAAATYDIPAPRGNAFTGAMVRGWSLENVVEARTAPPVNIYDGAFAQLNGAQTQVRPDLISGIPLYLYGSQYPGGRIINNTPNAGGPGCVGPFCPPPTNSNGTPIRQGDLGRNAFRGFGAVQWDFAIHRDFRVRENFKLQFRAEMFNVLNHPNFGPPIADISNATEFGQSTQVLGQSLGGGNLGGGAFNPLYQIGGPRSIQLALKLLF